MSGGKEKYKTTALWIKAVELHAADGNLESEVKETKDTYADKQRNGILKLFKKRKSKGGQKTFELYEVKYIMRRQHTN
jgi:hypothetical protein